MHKELHELLEAAKAGDNHAISAASEMGLSLLKFENEDYRNDPDVVLDACMAIAIAGKNGTVCEHGALVPCLANKVIRVQTSLGRIAPGAVKGFKTPYCHNDTCPNHPRFECEPVESDSFLGYNEPDEYRRKSLDL